MAGYQGDVKDPPLMTVIESSSVAICVGLVSKTPPLIYIVPPERFQIFVEFELRDPLKVPFSIVSVP